MDNTLTNTAATTLKGYEPTAYVRATVKLAGGRRRSFWGLVTKRTDRLVMYRVYDRFGEQQDEMVVAAPVDIVRENPARISLKYGEMEPCSR
jgi:hypothetical protein